MEIREVTAVGANPRELMLDHQKKLRAYAANLSGGDASSFLRMYAEEMTAAGGAGDDAAPLMLAPPSASAPARVRATAPLIVVVAIAAVLAVLIVFRACA